MNNIEPPTQAQQHTAMRRPCFVSLGFLLHVVLIITAIPATKAAPPGVRLLHQRLAFAGGFGNTSSSKTKKPRKKKKGRFDQDILTPPSPHKEPVLDKWGLPPPTEEDIFPKLPPGTELIPAQKENYGLAEILQALSTRMSLPGLKLHFDEQGIEKSPPQDATPVQVRLVHQSPPVLVLDHFLTPPECLAVQRVAMPDQRSQSKELLVDEVPVQVDSATFSTLAQSKRTSTSWFCPYAAVPTVLAKAQHLLGVDINVMEEPQIVRYKTGQEFSWHYDEVPSAQLDNGGQRVGTFLVYLNDVARGGGTEFRDLCDPHGHPLTVQPKQGRVCLFFPADGEGHPDDRTLHKGQVARDEKRIIQIWFHERDYRATLPPNNRQEDALKRVQEEARRLGYL